MDGLRRDYMDDDDADSPCDWHFYCLPTAAAPAAPSSNLPDQELHDSEQKDKPNEDKNPCYFDSALGSESETENAPNSGYDTDGFDAYGKEDDAYDPADNDNDSDKEPNNELWEGSVQVEEFMDTFFNYLNSDEFEKMRKEDDAAVIPDFDDVMLKECVSFIHGAQRAKVKKNIGNCFLAGLRQQELNVMSCSW